MKSIGRNSNIWYSISPIILALIRSDIIISVIFLSLFSRSFFFFSYYFLCTIVKGFSEKYKNCKYIEVAKFQVCTGGVDELEKKFQEIIDAGGEGVILRDPSAPYQPGRSPGYLKHKVCNFYLFSFFLFSYLLSFISFRCIEIQGC